MAVKVHTWQIMQDHCIMLPLQNVLMNVLLSATCLGSRLLGLSSIL